MSLIAFSLFALTIPSAAPNADSTRRLVRTPQRIVSTAADSVRRRPPAAREGSVGALGLTPATTTTLTTVAASPSPRVASFSWPGVYDLVGSGFPEGDRMAVLEIGRKDTSYTLQKLSGPPGNATIFQVTGNRAHIVWNLGTDLMYVDLRGSGDSLTGEWFIGDEGGPLRGARRR
jgi:hypothetical protein